MGEQTERKEPTLIDRLAAKIVDGRQIILIATIVLVILSLFTRKWVDVENELSAYLPDDSSTKIALDLMDEQFTTFGTARIMVENLTLDQAEALSDELEDLDGVQSVTFDDSADHYNSASALYDITFDYDEDDTQCLVALDNVEKYLSGYDVYRSTELGNTKADIIDSEINVIMVYVAIVVVTVLILTSETYAEVPVLLITFVTAMILNSGCNFVLGKISFVSNSVTSILQLALSLDYAIILVNHFKEEYRTQELRDAVISALSKAIVEISASSLTTIGGMFAMMFMQYKLGPDMAICLIKSIIFAMLSVFIVMPCLLMVFGPYLEKTRHKKFVPDIPFVGKFAYATRHFVPIIFSVVIVIACVISQHCPYVYGYDSIETPKLNSVQIADNKIKDTFGERNLVAIVVPAGNYDAEKAVLDRLKTYPEVDDVTGLASVEIKDGYVLTDALNARELSELFDIDYTATMGIYSLYAYDNNEYGKVLEDMEDYSIPLVDMMSYIFDEMDENSFDLSKLDLEIEDDDGEKVEVEDLREQIDNAKLQLKSDEYSRMLVYLNLPESADETYDFIDEMRELIAEYYPADDIYLAGNSTTDYDFEKTFAIDNTVVSAVSIIIVFIVLLFTFYSVGLSALLVLFIQGSIWINFSVPVFTKSPLFFISYLIVSSIQMGANIDYAIVVSSRYEEIKNKMPRRQAIIETMNFAFPTIITSGSILAISGILIGQMTSEAAIVGIGQSLGRGTIISMILVMFVLPQILLVGDIIVDKTAFTVPKPKVNRKKVSGRLVVDGVVRGNVNGRINGRVRGSIDGDMNLTVISGEAKEEDL